jgi:hypothetical protein
MDGLQDHREVLSHEKITEKGLRFHLQWHFLLTFAIDS